MNQMSIFDNLGHDTDLLLRSDAWLHAKRTELAQTLSLLLCDLSAIEHAIKAKNELQQKNKVAVLSQTPNGDNIIRTMPLPDAISTVKTECQNPHLTIGQIRTWLLDGYDVETSEKLKAAS